MSTMNRTHWYTSVEEMMMINPNATFIAIVDHESNWTEETQTYDEAIQLLRDLVEADGHHIFMRINRWRANSHFPGKNASMHSTIVWLDTQTGKTYSKTIRIQGVTYQMIASYQTRFLAYLKGKYPEKYRYW